MSFSISGFKEKAANRDKDFRYMALSDLLTELGKDQFKIDGNDEKKICEVILKLLEDNSPDVQGMAVKCLGPLMKKIHDAMFAEIVDTVTDHLLLHRKPELKDIAGIGLKTIITDCQQKDGPTLVKKIGVRLTGILTEKDATVDPKKVSLEDVKVEALELLNDLLTRFGNLMQKEHESLQAAILPNLFGRSVARKKAIACVGRLAVHINDKLFNDLMEYVFSQSANSKNADAIRTLIQVIGSISRSVGYRLGKFLQKVIPYVVKYSNDPSFESDDELRETCFHTFESLVLRCPKEISPYIDQITQLSLQFVKYDPNYEDGDMEDEQGDEDNEGDDEELYDQMEDDDLSWKVRRSSAKVLGAIISTRPELLQKMYSDVAATVVSRFKEREESVRLDILETFKVLLKQTSLATRRQTLADQQVADESHPITQLRALIPKMMPVLIKQLQNENIKEIKTRVAIFSLLRELVAITENLLGEYVGALLGALPKSLKSSNSNLKIEALSFAKTLLSSHSAEKVQPHLKAVLPALLKCLGDHFYKIIAETLRTLAELIKALRPQPSQPCLLLKEVVPQLSTEIFAKLKALDADQEVKDAAITAAGFLVAHLGDEMKSDLPNYLKVFNERLSNEITRLVTVKALAIVSSSALRLDLSSILKDVLGHLASFLKQNNRFLKQSSLQTLHIIISTSGGTSQEAVVVSTFDSILAQLVPLFSANDLHLSQLALQVTLDMLKLNPQAVQAVKEKLHQPILGLIQSSILQGFALESLLQLYERIVQINSPSIGFDFLFDSINSLAITGGSSAGNKTQTQLSRQCYNSMAQCLAVLCVAAPKEKRDKAVQKFLADIKTPPKGKGDQEVSAKLLALLALGEMGRRLDLTSYGSSLQSTVLSVLDSPTDDTTLHSAASFALGNIAVGNISQLLPVLLKEIAARPEREYLLLHALREVISKPGVFGASSTDGSLTDVVALLRQHSANKEEGTRNVVAECLGKLCLSNPTAVLPVVQSLLATSTGPAQQAGWSRATAITAVKFAVVETPQGELDVQLRSLLSASLSALLKDSELPVRRATLMTLNFAAHNKPSLVRQLLQRSVHLVYTESEVKKELIHVVDLGPFKHTVDDGLDLRKSAYECMYTLLESCYDCIDIGGFVARLVAGLEDVYDIKLLAHLMLVRLAVVSPAGVLGALDSLLPPLKTTLTTKLKDTAIPQDIERNHELIRSALRAVVALNRIPNVDQNRNFEEFMKICKGGDLAERFEALRKDMEHDKELEL